MKWWMKHKALTLFQLIFLNVFGFLECIRIWSLARPVWPRRWPHTNQSGSLNICCLLLLSFWGLQSFLTKWNEIRIQKKAKPQKCVNKIRVNLFECNVMFKQITITVKQFNERLFSQHIKSNMILHEIIIFTNVFLVYV